MLDLAYAELDALNQDEVRWEETVEQFHGYRQQWQSQGVLPMLRNLLMDFHVPARLSQSLDGERALTNLLHLAELLQQAATQLDGEQSLIRYLEDTVEEGRGSSKDSILHLESDDDRVKVITIHKSKGLEYPLVYLPFICSFRPADKTNRRCATTKTIISMSRWNRMRPWKTRRTTNGSPKTCVCYTWP